jgi:hypothetical protein
VVTTSPLSVAAARARGSALAGLRR